MVPTPSLVLPFSLSLPHPHVSSRLCHPSCSLSLSRSLSVSLVRTPSTEPNPVYPDSRLFSLRGLVSPFTLVNANAVSCFNFPSPHKTERRTCRLFCSRTAVPRPPLPSAPSSSGFVIAVAGRALAIPRERIIIRLRMVHIVITGTRIHRIVSPTIITWTAIELAVE